MAYYPIIQKNKPPTAAVGHRRLPTNYMGDFSVLGFRVDDCDQALSILDRHAYPLKRSAECVEIAIESPSRVYAVVELLHANGLECEMADLADGIYQG